MALSAQAGPTVVYGSRNPPGTGVGGTNNPDVGASLFDRGIGLFDGRAGYNTTRLGAIGWLGGATDIPLVNAAPSTISAVNVAASQAVTAGVAMTLAVASTGITVVPTGGTVVWPSGNTVPAGSLVLDGLPALVSMYGSIPNPSTGRTALQYYDPTSMLSRNVRITTNADDTGGFYTVSGYDIYGYPLSQKVTGVSSGVAATTKAFKFVASIVPSGTINSTAVTVGTGDVFSFPLRVNSVGFVRIWWAGALAVAQTTPFGTASAFVFADATNPATQVTGDTRGTIYLGTATPSNGTRVLQIYASLDVNAMTAVGGVFGVTQV